MSFLRRRFRLRTRDAIPFAVTDVATVRARSSAMLGTLKVISAVLACLGTVVGVVGLAALLQLRTAEQRRDIAIRRCCGATAVAVISEAMLYAQLTTITGTICALVVARPLVEVLEGWTEIQMHLSVQSAVACLVASMGVTSVISLWPAARAAHVDPATALRV